MTTEQKKKQSSYYRGFKLGCVCGIAFGIASIVYGPTIWDRLASSSESDEGPPVAVEPSSPQGPAKAEEEEAAPTEPKDARPGRKLYAAMDNSGVYKEPSTGSTVLGWVDRGHELVEIEYREGWVSVGVARTGIVGWMPVGSVSTRRSGGTTKLPMTPAFKRFRVAFDALNERVQAATGARFFTGAEDMGDGIVQVTATDTWLTGTHADQISNVKTIYDLWKAAKQTTLPLFVNVVDKSGRIRLSYPDLR
ncbi:MAG: SH3 domain-containing protein [Planctomycetota bacterium]|jgi:hypothetical protein